MNNHNKLMNNINCNKQKDLSPLYNSLEQNNLKKSKLSKNIIYNKNISIGLNLNIFKSPLCKLKYINFYSPKVNNNNQNLNNINNIISPINKKSRNNFNNNIKNKSVLTLSDIFSKPITSVNLDGVGKKIYNGKYKLMPRKNNIKININSKHKFNEFSLKNFKVATSPMMINKNRSSENININEFNNINLKNLSHNLSEERKFKNTINIALSSTFGKKNNNIFSVQNNCFKKLSPSFSRNKEKNIFTINDINKNNHQRFEIKNGFNNIFINKNQNKYVLEDFKKVKGDSVGKKVYYPINFKKFFYKKDIIKDKDLKIGLKLLL